MIYLRIFLQLADIATTHYALRTGIGTEANPVLHMDANSPNCTSSSPTDTHTTTNRGHIEHTSVVI